ncbi:MAG TPA: phosphoenolpyruvate--protein phosphotransferase [Myxococcales bacterium]|nr:phosphoenolpyruvate--protein phosphotransferase [Myxococcales bacterium]
MKSEGTEPAGGSVVLRGIGASPGVAIGPAFVFERGKVRTPRYHLPPEKLDAELARLRGAFQLSDRQLGDVRLRLEKDQAAAVQTAFGGAREQALIVEAYQSMLRDPYFLGEIEGLVRSERVNSEWAVRRVLRRVKGALGQGDDYIRERRADLEFLGDRIVRNLLGQVADVVEPPPDGCVLVARDLSPADAALFLVPGKVLGLVTDQGGRTGHTALVARAREIPSVVGVGDATSRISRGDTVALDGVQGTVVLRPSEGELRTLEEGRTRFLHHEAELLTTRDLPTSTLDGTRVRLLGNIEFRDEVPSVWSHGGEGIGLYRTEFLYLDRRELPTEDDHVAIYRELLERSAPRPVTIRTFDLGADKVPGGIRRREVNPAMGLRAIRFTLRSPALFRTQLRALLRASSHGQLRIMFPMVSGLTELREARSHLEFARAELAREGRPMAERIPVGIMIELPAAAAIADRLARECDFFSIGTNDLIQYTLAADRANPSVSYLFRPMHLGILRMIQFTVRAAHDAGIPVAMCGEMAGDPFYAEMLVGMGLDELSMTASSIPAVKRVIRALRKDDAAKLVQEAMGFGTAEEIERFVRARMQEKYGDLMEDR